MWVELSAAALGAHVIAVDVAEPKLRVTERFGAAETIDASGAKDLGKQIRKSTGGGVDVAAEVISPPETIAAAVEAVRPGGRVVSSATPRSPPRSTPGV